jgi:hypothetical protein
MGGGEHGARGRLTSARAWFGRWQGVFAVAKETVPLPFSTATVCTRHPATARPQRRDRPKRGGESYVREKGTKVQSCPQGRHVCVLGCTMARWRRVRVATRANANASANGTTRRRGRERHGTANNGDKERLGQESERASTMAATPASEFVPAWHEGRHHQRRRGGAERLRVPPRREVRGIHMGREAVVLALGGHGP